LSPRFALNHMVAPALRYDALLRLAANLRCIGVEYRNDLPAPLFDGASPQAVGEDAAALGLRILTLAEVKSFNDWTNERLAEARRLAEIAKACGAEAISLIPRNDGRGLGNGERQANLRLAMRELKPLLEEYRLLGYIEPLGFESCSLRFKADAVETMEALGATDRFRLIHDTFHHHLAGNGPIFAAHTAIVHISGVSDPDVGIADMRDRHRILVDEADRLGTVRQIEALVAAGFKGPISFECFAPSVHRLADPAADIARSFSLIESRLAQVAA